MPEAAAAAHEPGIGESAANLSAAAAMPVGAVAASAASGAADGAAPAGPRIAFAGTPAFADRALAALLRSGVTVPLVLTQPDRPAGRGLKVQPSPVKARALQHGIAVAQPRGLRLDGRFGADAEATRQRLAAAAPDVLVVAAYGLILPRWLLELPRRGCLNIHASLLPRWRGAAPIHRAIEAGDPATGIAIMRMDEGLDTGPVLLEAAVPIAPDDTAGSLHDRLAEEGGRRIVEALARLDALVPRPQPGRGVTYAEKVEKREAAIDWRGDAVAIERRLRAFDPFPGATATLGGEPLKLWRASVIEASGTPGMVLGVGTDGIDVACGQGAVRLRVLQRAGGRRLDAAAFLAGHALRPGDRFELPTRLD